MNPYDREMLMLDNLTYRLGSIELTAAENAELQKKLYTIERVAQSRVRSEGEEMVIQKPVMNFDLSSLSDAELIRLGKMIEDAKGRRVFMQENHDQVQEHLVRAERILESMAVRYSKDSPEQQRTFDLMRDARQIGDSLDRVVYSDKQT